MKLRILLSLGLLFGLAACATLTKMPVGNRAVPQPAKAVDLDRYLGRWYEIYRYDAPFQKGCEAVSADYARNADGTIRVVNRCHKNSVDGPEKTATGRARIVDAATNAKLKVSFFGPFYGDYWILDHDDQYQWAIIGEPSGRYLWVLTRTPRPSEAEKAALRQRVEHMGYDWTLVRETRQ